MILKNSALLVILVFSIGNPVVYAQNFQAKPQDISISSPEKELRIGETLEYSVEWLGIPVGKIVLKVEGTTTLNNHECYHITAVAIPNKFFQRFHDLEYNVHSYIDKQSFLPIRFEKIRRIDNETNYVTIDFDHKKNEAVFLSEGSSVTFEISPLRNKIEARNPITTKIPAGTQDLFSSFYYFRILKIKEGGSYPINIYYEQRNWLVDMKVHKPFTREIRKKGSFPVVEVSPDSPLNNYILGRRRFIVYLTTDSRRIPLEFKMETALGPIFARIQDLP